MVELSIVTPAKSLDQPDLLRLKAALARQTYRNWEHLVITDGNAEEARAHGILQARGDIVGLLDADNDLRDRDFLRTMVWYAKDPAVVGAYTAQYDYVEEDTLLSRYFALLGANDPLVWWLGKADRQGYLARRAYTKIVHFRDAIPTLGDNGFFFKRRYAYAIDPKRHFHIDFCEDLRRAGFFSYWVVASQAVWHRTGDTLGGYVRRRWHYARTLYWRRLADRRYRMVSSRRDWLYACLFGVASLCVVPHLWVAFRGYRRRPDIAWFIHPVVCGVLTLTYTLAWLSYLLSSVRWKGRRH